MKQRQRKREMVGVFEEREKIIRKKAKNEVKYIRKRKEKKEQI